MDRYSGCEVKEADRGQGGGAVRVEAVVPVKVPWEPVRIQRGAAAEVDLKTGKKAVILNPLASCRVPVEGARSLVPSLGSIVSVG